MKKENTVRFTIEELRKWARQGNSDIDWNRIIAMTPDEIERNAIEDNRRHGIRDDWYKTAVLLNAPKKERISIRIDQDVLQYFRGQGKGYQSRINSVLRAFVATNSGL